MFFVQIDRLKFLAKGISRKHSKAKKEIDDLFSATDRMRLLKAEVATLVGKAPLIPCVFWLVQKASLLQETPLLGADQKVCAADEEFPFLVLTESSSFTDQHPACAGRDQHFH